MRENVSCVSSRRLFSSLLALLFMAWHVNSSRAFARQIIVLGRLGPIVVNDNGGFFREQPLVRRVSPSVVSINGRLFELNRFGQLRPLFIDARGNLLNATEPDIERQLANLYAQNLGRFGPGERQIVDTFLRARGIDPNQIAGNFKSFGGDLGPDSKPEASGLPPAGQGPVGPHGNGSGTFAQPGGGRPIAESNPIAADGTLLPSACRNMAAAVCGSMPSPATEERLVQSAKRSLILSYLQSRRLSFGQFAQAVTTILFSPQRSGSLLNDFFRFMAGELPGFRDVLTSVKRNLSLAIDSQPFDPNEKERMKQVMNSVQIRVAPPLNNPRALQAWVEGCGPDGLSMGAFSIPSTGDLVICPGMILRSVALGGLGQMESFLTHVIAHEWTHHFGGDVDPETRRASSFRPNYTGLLDCLAAKHGDFDPVANGGETVADFMGIKTLVQRLKGESPAQAFPFIRNALSPLCSSEADGVHPSGNFRVGIVLGEDPDILRLLGCSVPPDACGINGTFTGGRS